MPKKFHLGWFMNFAVDAWNGPFAAGGRPWDGEFYIDMVKAMERACFDYIMVEDTLMISEAYGHSSEMYLKRNLMAPKGDPSPLAALLAYNTRKIGVVITLSTLGYPPFLLARLCATLDNIAGGRFGWNIVTSGEDLSARNFGLEELPPRELRYDMADEYVDLVKQLWTSWEPGAVVLDRENDTYADYTKVKPIHFEGKYFKSRGPLNCVPPVQPGRPTLVQAGGSPRGRQFAAEHADSIVCSQTSVEAMKAYRDDVRARAAAAGRDPDEIKVLFVISPTLAATEEEAHRLFNQYATSEAHIEYALAAVASITDIDFSKFDLDKPLPELTTNGEMGSLIAFAQWGTGKTLRQCCVDWAQYGLIGMVGTPDQVADRMADAMDYVGGDGFLLCTVQPLSRRFINEVCEGLVPALQRRGLVRTEYTQSTLRQTLHEF
jgi:FMN-dependent oxidoreductase (nitrilotriacetate monooxygenase family)